jgi:hypothetical protein
MKASRKLLFRELSLLRGVARGESSDGNSFGCSAALEGTGLRDILWVGCNDCICNSLSCWNCCTSRGREEQTSPIYFSARHRPTSFPRRSPVLAQPKIASLKRLLLRRFRHCRFIVDRHPLKLLPALEIDQYTINLHNSAYEEELTLLFWLLWPLAYSSSGVRCPRAASCI